MATGLFAQRAESEPRFFAREKKNYSRVANREREREYVTYRQSNRPLIRPPDDIHRRLK